MMQFISTNFFGECLSSPKRSENSSMGEYSLAKATVEGSSPFFRLGLSRLELLTLRLSGVYSNQLSYKPVSIVPGKIRTLNFQIRSLILYPIELQALPGEKGLEPLTYGFGDHCSTIGTILLFFVYVPFV